ncbi:hypothetical protein ANO11243_088780 [Dothideomycetidae sp. 11243]|nr:hypothetical protein ANO11243_088780 [fungal sp. No.11243]
MPVRLRSSVTINGLRHSRRAAPLSGRAGLASLAAFKVPEINNEPNKHYAPGSLDRQGLTNALNSFKQRLPLDVPAVVAGKHITQNVQTQPNPSSHTDAVARWSSASAADVNTAVDAALSAKCDWEAMPFSDRAAIFLKAADLISDKYRYDIMTATMLGQGKNAWQAEIDSAAESCDFLRFNVKYAQELYNTQPVHNSPGVWNRVEYRPLEGFVYAISPFNFTAIAANLPSAPALMGNVVVWKPSPAAMASNWLVYQILLEAGLPKDVIQFVPGDAEEVTRVALGRKEFSALHYTGSTAVFRSLFSKIAANVADGTYVGYPRVVGETGGKNFHLLHETADAKTAALQTVRGAFEYQGQKCSACSRAYVPSSLFKDFSTVLVSATQSLKIGGPEHFDNFIGPVIHRASFDKLKNVIDEAKSDPELELLAGGTYDDSKGFFIAPTVYKTSNPHHKLMSTELFGPVLVVYEYDASFAEVCKTIDATTSYALTGAVFARDRAAVRFAEDALRDSAGNFYINTKCTGAVVGQQPFGGARMSGTNDKAGSQNLLSRFVSARAVKEEFTGIEGVEYPSNAV